VDVLAVTCETGCADCSFYRGSDWEGDGDR
jgi:hypothetical protein